MFFYNPSSLLTPVYAFNVLQNSKLVLYAYNYAIIRGYIVVLFVYVFLL